MDKYAYEIKFNDFGIVYAVATSYSEAESLALEMISKFSGGIDENNINSIIKVNQTKPVLYE